MKKYVKSGYEDYDPNGPLSWDEFDTLQEISEQEDETEFDINVDLFNVIADRCKAWCDELGIDTFKSILNFDTQKQIDKFCEGLASKIFNAYITRYNRD